MIINVILLVGIILLSVVLYYLFLKVWNDYLLLNQGICPKCKNKMKYNKSTTTYLCSDCKIQFKLPKRILF